MALVVRTPDAAIALARNWLAVRKDVREQLIAHARDINPRPVDGTWPSDAVRKLYKFPNDLSEQQLIELIDSGGAPYTYRARTRGKWNISDLQPGDRVITPSNSFVLGDRLRLTALDADREHDGHRFRSFFVIVADDEVDMLEVVCTDCRPQLSHGRRRPDHLLPRITVPFDVIAKDQD